MRVKMNRIDLALEVLMIVPVAACLRGGFGQTVVGRRDMGTPVGPYTEPIWLNRTLGMFGVVRYGCGPPIDDVLAGPSKK